MMSGVSRGLTSTNWEISFKFLMTVFCKKLREKNLDMIIANDLLAKDAGFGSDKNVAKIINKKGIVTKELPLMPKTEMAEEILGEILKIK